MSVQVRSSAEVCLLTSDRAPGLLETGNAATASPVVETGRWRPEGAGGLVGEPSARSGKSATSLHQGPFRGGAGPVRGFRRGLREVDRFTVPDGRIIRRCS